MIRAQSLPLRSLGYPCANQAFRCFARKKAVTGAYSPLLSDTGGIADGLIPVKKPCWFDVKA